MSDMLTIQRDSDYWGEGDYVSPLCSVEGQFTRGKEYKINWIDWDDVVYVEDDRGIENGWHASQWKFVREESWNEI